MELELFNTRLKYENDMLWRWYDMSGGRTLNNPYWKIVKQTPNYKGNSSIKINKKMYLYHRVVYKICNPDWDITDVSSDNEVDHICGVRPKDNSIKNLRILNHQQNQWNCLHYAKGYYFCKKHNKYKAQIHINGKTINLGSYDTEEEAHTAYLKAKPLYHPI